MKVTLALKAGILAAVALVFLSGCFLLENNAIIRFENGTAISLDFVVEGEDFGTAAAGWWTESGYTWYGPSSTFAFWEAYETIGGFFYDSGSIMVQDGYTSTVIF